MTAIEIDDPSESRRAIGRAVLLSTAINSAMLVVAIVGAVVIYASVSDMAQPRVHGKLAEHAAVTSPARESPPYGIPIGSVLAFPADSTVLPTRPKNVSVNWIIRAK